MESESQILSSLIYGYFSNTGCWFSPEDVHNMLILLQTYLILLLCVNYNPCYACGQAEYKIGDKCCPMCSPGSRVYRHCTAWTSTSCVPCIGSTFSDQPNGLEQCSPCTVCDGGLGVKTVRACTPTSDTMCGVLEGHYCINPYKGGCRAAHKHTACKPGQFIKQPGTEYTDTVCEDCSDNSYSDGSFTSCKPHTDCESRGLVTVKAGDQAADSESKEKYSTSLSVAAVIAAIAVTIYIYKKKIMTYLFLLCVNYNPCYACGQAEYKFGEECCSMCHPGSCVTKHCTASTNTSCAPCTESLYNDQLTDLENCSPCTVCAQDLGVKTVRACTPSSDTVCGVLEGHYCINPYKGGCRAAHKNTACRPGQFIKQPGTEYTDTVCEDCSDNSYSDGSFTSCKPHTDCESRGLVTVNAGDQAADSECGEKSFDIEVSAGIVAAAVIAAIAVTIYILYKKKNIPWYRTIM